MGYGPPSTYVTISMLEEAPSGPPQEIVVKAMGSEALNITWMVRIINLL